MLYVFAGFPGKGNGPGCEHLHAGGLQHCIEPVEELAIFQHSPNIDYLKEGVFTPGDEGEWLYSVEYRIS
mgnify:CR=1 FL=1